MSDAKGRELRRAERAAWNHLEIDSISSPFGSEFEGDADRLEFNVFCSDVENLGSEFEGNCPV
jgi:hypothetical protein